MKERIKTSITILKAQFLAFWVVPLLLVVCHETNLLPVGHFAADPQMQYILDTLSIMLTIASIPLALKLFSIVLKKDIDESSFLAALKKYELWSGLRLGILALGVLTGIITYYLTLNNIGGFCALIGLAASLFCFPSEDRLRNELHIADIDK